MRRRSTFTTFAIAAVAGSLLLSACGDAEADAGPTPIADLTSSAAEPADGDPHDHEALAEEDGGLSPPPSSTREPISIGPLEDGVFCSGINGLAQFQAPNIQDLSVEEAAQASLRRRLTDI